MHLVEDDQPVALQRGVVLQPAGEHSLGDHLDAGVGPDVAFVARLVADGVAHPFAEQRGHPLSGSTRRQPPRLEHHDSLICKPRFAPQHQRRKRGLTRSRRRHEDGRAVFGARSEHRRQRIENR